MATLLDNEDSMSPMTARAAPWPLQSGVSGITWPAVPTAPAATVLAVLHQLEQSQWLPSADLLALQLRQLEGLLRHAFATVPWYRKHWRDLYDPKAPLTYERFARLPRLSRRTLQDGFNELSSTNSPMAHGPTHTRGTSGSTGAPVRFLATQLSGLYWNAMTLRDHLWHRRDLRAKLAVIRRETDHFKSANWGAATAGVVNTGPSVGNSVRSDAATLLAWLQREQPGYLLTYPSLVVELARLSLVRKVRLPGLLEVRTIAESLSDEVRALCHAAWGVPLVDVYSASEAGYMAVQCPTATHYHVQAEGVLLEILDDQGTPCAPGQIGRIVVTPLHNFAMPLVRYDIGDYAEVGETCACGRGLPVLRRILGRVRNTLVTVDGQRYWPVFGTQALMDSVPVQQYQFVQTTPQQIEARLVVATPLSVDQETQFRQRVMSQLPAGMDVQIVYRDHIGRSASGKFEEFISEVSVG